MPELTGILFGVTIPLVGVSAVALMIIGIVQEGKTMSRGEAIRGAFTYVVSFVMLGIMIVSSVYLLQQAARLTIFPKAQITSRYQEPPPTLFFTSDVTKGSTALTCASGCELTEADRTTLASWRTEYQEWRAQRTAGKLTLADKRDLVNAASFLIVALVLYWWFFLRTAQREAKAHLAEQGKPTQLRTAYFYLAAFTGLIGVVASSALLVNVALKSAFGIAPDQSTAVKVAPVATSPVSTSAAVPGPESIGVQTVINCREQCGLTADDVTLAQRWSSDYAAWQRDSGQPQPASVQTDLAGEIPLLLVTLPIFAFHLTRIRRETSGSVRTPSAGTPPPPTVS